MFVGISFQNIKTIMSNAIKYKFTTKIYRSAVDLCACVSRKNLVNERKDCFSIS